MDGEKKLPRTIAVLVCLLLLLSILFIFLSLLGLEVSALLKNLTSIKQKAIETLDSIQEFIFLHLNITIEDQFKLLKNEKPFYDNTIHILFGSASTLVTTFILVQAYFFFYYCTDPI
ncbi:MAG: hypothetical protein M0D53_12100 [Flavobacterium sp. JAD_PAG50586_2]|nr:MAG: hypothetical protein M0D53_12100 [Flavobacterium sp. JAD_PAG50586_2]